MPEPTKSCHLTEEEISCLIGYHGRTLDDRSMITTNHSETIERINYLHKRLKAFNEPASEVQPAPEAAKGWASN
jgi:hypothetical protein